MYKTHTSVSKQNNADTYHERMGCGTTAKGKNSVIPFTKSNMTRKFEKIKENKRNVELYNENILPHNVKKQKTVSQEMNLQHNSQYDQKQISAQVKEASDQDEFQSEQEERDYLNELLLKGVKNGTIQCLDGLLGRMPKDAYISLLTKNNRGKTPEWLQLLLQKENKKQ